MGKTVEKIYYELTPAPFAIKDESWAEDTYAIVYHIDGPMGVPVVKNIPRGLPRPIPNADKPVWILLPNIDLSRYVFWGLFSLDSIVTTRTANDRQFGKTIKEILHSDIGFIKWGICEHHNFYINDDIIEYIRKNNLPLSEEVIALNNQRRKEKLETETTKNPK
jgi:hypothetical protein